MDLFSKQNQEEKLLSDNKDIFFLVCLEGKLNKQQWVNSCSVTWWSIIKTTRNQVYQTKGPPSSSFPTFLFFFFFSKQTLLFCLLEVTLTECFIEGIFICPHTPNTSFAAFNANSIGKKKSKTFFFYFYCNDRVTMDVWPVLANSQYRFVDLRPSRSSALI